ncbi:MAG TPA: hypothetical protein VK203_14415 [Nostocaceae cyanobacterium]|nr:hypothetical protein [Nostocaceae cyanobacterium]
MKINPFTIGLIIALLVGCSGTKQDATVTSTLESQQASKSRVTEQNEFDSVSFPQESCGEKLPNDPKAYPIKYYPVFIDYSDDNLQSIKSKYCKDARKKLRKTTGKDAIQVASFSSIERAKKFSKFMSEKLGSGEVGEPTVIEAKRTTEVIDAKAGFNLSVAKAAKLTPDQVEQLVSLDKNNEAGIDFKVIVPTHVPNGFQISNFEVRNTPDETIYRIVYRNSSDFCFSIEGNSGGWGSGPEEERSVEVLSPALGKVILGYTEFSAITKKPWIAFQGAPIIIGERGYFFNSPENKEQNCNTISLQEAIKIVESLQYLNP